MSPFASFETVMQAFLTGFMILAPVAGGLACVWRGLQYFFSNDIHKKSELKDTMTTYVIVTICCLIAGGAIKWVAGMV